MFRGLLGGVFWGGLLGAVILVIGSLVAPLPADRLGNGQADAGTMPETDGIEAADPVTPEPAILEVAEPPVVEAPAIDPAPPVVAEAPATEGLVAPEIGEAPDALPEADPVAVPDVVVAVAPEAAQAPETPQTPDVAETTAPPPPVTPEPEVEITEAVEDEAPALPEAEDLAQPVVPETADPEPTQDVEVADDASPADESTMTEEVAETDVPAAPLAPVTEDVATAPEADAPASEPELEIAAVPSVPEQAEEAPSTPQIIQIQDRAPDVATDAPTGIGQPVTGIGQPAGFGNAEGVRVNRLPRIGDAPAAAEPEQQAAEADPSDETLPALERFAIAFENADALPLFSVIVLDLGADNGGLERSALSTFPFPVTFAIPADRDDATEAAQAYRDAGFEVVMMAGELPQRATPSDLEVAFGVFQSAVPEAVAVLDPPNDGFQANRTQAAQVVEILGAAGYGLLSVERGLNNAQQIAEREGVPSALIFRDLDEAQGDPDLISRTLDRAAFRAGQDGNVIVMASSRPQTVAALFAWALEGRAEGVALAPVSAVLQGQ